ncbi:hypothetical protein [Nocardia sp. BMG111209]|uniref:hypothetical protein n=1 Tax=Nocardia sp. BMG111209 TaxID=1160137 RepID=UPI0003768E8A|nr:hypothetical protein [Nocardia sp. BMG111209]
MLRKERTGRRCSKCRKVFALEPKESPLGMHDVRLHKLAEQLGDGRGLAYTITQLWYAAGRKKLPDPRSRVTGIRFGVSVPIVILGFFAMISRLVPPAVGILAVVVLVVAVQIVISVRRQRIMDSVQIRIPVDFKTFQREVAQRWAGVYRFPPPGSVDESLALPPPVPRPRFAVLCPERSVLTCLAANHATQRHDLALAQRIDQVPPAIPVIVLHDASLPALRFADQVRAQLAPRPVLNQMSPRTVLAKGGLLRLRTKPPAPEELAAAPRNVLSQEEFDWLAAGCWSPIAALPPARLLALVDKAVDRIEQATDPDRRRARAVGFLSWPA